jgi:type II secretory pathway component PulF
MQQQRVVKIFYFKAGTAAGKIIEDYIDTGSIKEAKKLLKKKGYLILDLKKQKSEKESGISEEEKMKSLFSLK